MRKLFLRSMLLFAVVIITSCSTQTPIFKSDLSKKEVIKILNDGCTFDRSGREKYVVKGKRYRTLASSKGYKKRGIASWYGPKFDGKQTACGEIYDMYKYTAAHKTLPLPSYVKVINIRNRKSVIVKINDRGPFIDNRVIDLSYAAAKKIDMLDKGTAIVRINTISQEEAAEFMKKNKKRLFSGSIFERIIKDNEKFFLQVGAFSDQKNAKSLKMKISELGIKTVFINKARVNGKAIYRVRIGPIKTNELYNRVVDKLTSLSLNINIISE
ncbi:MAG: septal ring lytic transglycosylase RlpA family protein [Gammaproteobacteria bacterium]|nr:septal ring lytic transglycosylase RlpA family protein [Gammaproteobacteria bacterium]